MTTAMIKENKNVITGEHLPQSKAYHPNSNSYPLVQPAQKCAGFVLCCQWVDSDYDK